MGKGVTGQKKYLLQSSAPLLGARGRRGSIIDIMSSLKKSHFRLIVLNR